MTSAVMALPEPCNTIVLHAAHQFTVVNPWNPVLAWTIACPGWAPAAVST